MDHWEATIIGPQKARISANVTRAGLVSIAMSAKQIRHAIVSCLEERVVCATSRALL